MAVTEYSNYLPPCNSECLTGKCPHKKCIKYLVRNYYAGKTDFDINILKSDGVNERIISDKGGYGIAVDLGTTTVVAALYDMGAGLKICEVAGVNRQIVYGTDIIARIGYCQMNKNGTATLSRTVRMQLNEMICALSNISGISVEYISHMSVCANTVMSHILSGISPISMGEYPFNTVSLFGDEISCADIGIELNAGCYIAPCVSAFVGGDIVGGLLAINFRDNDRAAFMDIGTNGELAVISDKCIFVAATAAGPAFEGAGISCGMAAAPGAICHVTEDNGKLMVETVGDEKPCGITGSGLIDAAAVFLGDGSLNSSGRIEDTSKYAQSIDGEIQLNIAANVYLTQKDIREFQTAKAALSAGLITLCGLKGFGVCEIDKLFLAGAFGNYMDIGSAKTVGLIPDGVITINAGNTSLKGAALLLMSDAARNNAQSLSNHTVAYNLADSALFMENYIDCMALSRLL